MDKLLDWQIDAVEAWRSGDVRGGDRGTLEVFTGGGKTLIGLACFEQAVEENQDVRLVVVVPTVALAGQWLDQIVTHLDLDRDEVGLMGAGGGDDLADHRALVAVLNSAADHLPGHGLPADDVMLIVDECHRAGAEVFQKVLDTPAHYRLGLSATPQRDETDEHGQRLDYDDSVLGRKLGRIVFRFGLREAREIGWLPSYEVHHHAITLQDDEREDYERQSRRVDDAATELRDAGHPTSAARSLASRSGPVGEAARAYVAATAARKDLLYRARQRHRVAALLVQSELATSTDRRILLFHERVAETDQLHAALAADLPGFDIAVEHSNLPDAHRGDALRRFGTGESQVLVSVRSLIEGIDVPAADVGISVASSSSVRQRVQALGRVLRRSFEDPEGKQAAMHVLYVGDTVDDFIYAREDWGDLIGEDVNSYWTWPIDGPPTREDGPPRTPRPTEHQIWERLGSRVPEPPVAWDGVLPEFEYSVDTRGNVRTASGATIADPGDVAAMVMSVRSRPGGRFRVTPELRLVVVQDDAGAHRLVGRLDAPFEVREVVEMDAHHDAGDLGVGEVLPGSPDRDRGTYQLRRKRGGVIERRRGRHREFALADGDLPGRHEARRVLDAWRRLDIDGMPVHVSSTGIVWYEADGAPRHLTVIDSDLVFPSDAGAA